MSNYRPLVIVNGVVQQLSDSDTLYVASFSIGGFVLAAPTADNQILQATGAGTAAWTTDVQTLTSLAVDSLTLDNNVIASSGGVYVFSTSGNLVLRAQTSGSIYIDTASKLWVREEGSYTTRFTVSAVDGSVGIGSDNLSNTGVYMNVWTSGSGIASQFLVTGRAYSSDGAAYSLRVATQAYPANGQQARQVNVEGSVRVDAGNTIPWLIGMMINPIPKSGDGTVTNAASLYVYPQTIGVTNYAIIVTGGVSRFNDNAVLAFGNDLDATVTYNGTDLLIDPDAVGSGFLKIDGRMKTVYGNNVRFSHIFASTLGTPTTGTMKIRLATSWQGRQFTYIISGVDNVTGSWYLRFGGAPSNSGGGGWNGQSCSLFGKPPFKQVRVAHDGTGACILLGNESTSWSYQLVLIDMETDSGFTAPAITMTMTFSNNEAVDWTLASVEDCPIYLTAGVEIEDDGAGGVNLLVNGISVSENIEVGGSDVCRVLADNRTYYVRTTGNDTTGDGAAGTPFATVGRALDEIYKWVADENIITIDVGEGTFNETTLSPTYAYGSNLYVTGVAETHTSGCAVSSIGSVTALEAGLEYIDFIITLPAGYATATGQYIACKAASGGTNNHLVLGVHEVIGWNSGTRAATVRCVRRAGVTAVPSGAISLTDIRVIKTVLAFASGHGINMVGAYHGGNWDALVLTGNSSGYALNLTNGASIVASSSFATSDWNNTIYCAGNGNFFGDSTCHSFCRGSLIRVQNGGVAQIRYGTVLTGAKTTGIFCFVGATVAAYQVQMATCGNADGVLCYQGGFVDVSSGYVRDGNPTGNGCNANRGGGIDATSATISGYATSTATATNGYIIGP